MKAEDKFAVALGIFCVLLLIVGTLVSKRLASAPPRVIRAVWPVMAALTGGLFATFIFIARSTVKG
jgi:hypothetical protein